MRKRGGGIRKKRKNNGKRKLQRVKKCKMSGDKGKKVHEE
jgi:hypothetical protein